MSILIKCRCGKCMHVESELGGKKVRCPECRAVLSVGQEEMDITTRQHKLHGERIDDLPSLPQPGPAQPTTFAKAMHWSLRVGLVLSGIMLGSMAHALSEYFISVVKGAPWLGWVVGGLIVGAAAGAFLGGLGRKWSWIIMVSALALPFVIVLCLILVERLFGFGFSALHH